MTDQQARPCTRAQRWLWTLDALVEDRSEYNVYQAVRVRGPFRTGALDRAVAAVAATHELLRTCYRMTSGGLAGTVLPVDDRPVPVLPVASAADAVRTAERLVAEPFDLASERPLRLWVLEWAPDDRLLVMCSHHIAVDAWSMDLLWRGLAEAYDGAEPPVPPLGRDEIVRREDEARADEFYAEDVDYWLDQVAGWTALDLPADRPRPARRSGRGAEIAIELDPALGDVRVGGRGSTALAVAATAVLLTLSRWTGRADVALGAVVSGRDDPDLAEAIGYFVNTVVLREQVRDDDTPESLAGRVRTRTLEAYARAHVPFAELATAVAEHDTSRNPLVDVLLAWVDEGPNRFRPDGLDTAAVDVPAQTAKFDLSLTFTRRPGALRLGIAYATDLYDAGTVRRFARHVGAALRELAGDPSRPLAAVRLLDDDERRRLVSGSEVTDGPAVPIDPRSLPEMFDDRVRADPGAPAVLWGDATWSYADLDDERGRIAARLRERGVGPGARVAVTLDRSPSLVAALFAVLGTGGAYVPIDPSQPAERRRSLLRRARPDLELTGELLDAWAASPAADPGPDEPAGLIGPGSVAYVIHTSGSTGEPRGVVVTHRSVVNLTSDLAGRFGWGPGQVVAAVAPHSFDMSVPELLSPLLAGAAIRLVPREAAVDAARLAAELDGVTFAQLTPVHWQALLDHGWSDPGLRAACGAEAFPAALAGPLRAAVGDLWNLYGPTETTVWSTAHRVEEVAPDRPVPIGRPLSNTIALVLDPRGEPVPVGVAGELYLGGAGVASGYDDEPELTAERFVVDPFRAGGTLYRTGDVVRRRAGGELEFVARADAQVKVRGHRIEPGEVEAALERHPGVVRAAVTTAGEGAARCLVGYVVLRPGDPAVSVDSVRAFLGGLLPRYLLPAALTAVERLPLSANGKLDRDALPSGPVAVPDPVVPRTPAERAVAGAFGRVLGVDAVGAEDDFFVLGGHSLSAGAVVAALRERFGDRIDLRLVFAHPRVDALAAALTGPAPAGGAAPAGGPAPADGPASPAPGAPAPGDPGDTGDTGDPGDTAVTGQQRTLWLRQRQDPDLHDINVVRAVRLTGPLDADALERALHAVADRHEPLRSSFPADAAGEPRCVVDAAPPPLRRSSADDPAAALRTARDDKTLPFDVTRGPLWRARLIRLGAPGSGDHLLVLVFHHLVVDGPSFAVLWDELSVLLDGGTPEPLRARFADFARRQRSEPVPADTVAWWREHLGYPDTRLPATRTGAGPPRGGMCEIPLGLDPGPARRLRDLARAEGTTVFTVALCALAAVLAPRCGVDRPVLGCSVTGRDRPELDALIGVFVHRAAIWVDCAGDPTFRELLARGHAAMTDARRHQRLPFTGQVRAALGEPDRPLPARILLNVVPDAETPSLPGLRTVIEPVPVGAVPAGADLRVELHGAGDGYGGSLMWDPADHDRAAMDALAAAITGLLVAAPARPWLRLGELSGSTGGGAA